jgi:PIN domain
MATASLDSSALLKLYFPERGSAWIQTFVQTNHIVISELAIFEAVSTIRRRYTSGVITDVEASNIIDTINYDITGFEIVPVEASSQIQDYEDILFALPNALMVRTLDGIHLLAAVATFEAAKALTPPEPFVFVSSDAQLLRVAQAQKLPTENPEDHL